MPSTVQIESLPIFKEHLSPKARDLFDHPVKAVNPPGFNTIFLGFTVDRSVSPDIEIGLAKITNELVDTRIMASAFASGSLPLAVWNNDPSRTAVFMWFHSKYTRAELSKLYGPGIFCDEGQVGANFTGFPALTGEL